jgi:hypothetical protein
MIIIINSDALVQRQSRRASIDQVTMVVKLHGEAVSHVN